MKENLTRAARLLADAVTAFGHLDNSDFRVVVAALSVYIDEIQKVGGTECAE